MKYNIYIFQNRLISFQNLINILQKNGFRWFPSISNFNLKYNTFFLKGRALIKNTPVLASFYYYGVKPSNGTFIFKLFSKGDHLKFKLAKFQNYSKTIQHLKWTLAFSMWGTFSKRGEGMGRDDDFTASHVCQRINSYTLWLSLTVCHGSQMALIEIDGLPFFINSMVNLSMANC